MKQGAEENIWTWELWSNRGMQDNEEPGLVLSREDRQGT
jgi:hypothetical protein